MLDGYVAEREGVPRGLLLLKQSSPVGAEIYWMGVDPAYHRLGIGRALIEAAVEAVRTRGVRYLFVATLHPAIPYEPYERTRRFYEAMGFAFVLEEQFPTDPANPLGYYVKQLCGVALFWDRPHRSWFDAMRSGNFDLRPVAVSAVRRCLAPLDAVGPVRG